MSIELTALGMLVGWSIVTVILILISLVVWGIVEAVHYIINEIKHEREHHDKECHNKFN